MHIKVNVMDIVCSTCNFSRKPAHNLTFRNVLYLHWLLLGGVLFVLFLFFSSAEEVMFVQSSCI